MAKEALYIQEGEVINVTLAGNVSVGAVMVLGEIVGVAKNSGLTGEIIGADIEGVFEITAKTADVIAVGVTVYFDNTNKYVTTTSTSNTKAGKAISAKAATVAGAVYVKLNI